jgi:hypothetical protein
MILRRGSSQATAAERGAQSRREFIEALGVSSNSRGLPDSNPSQSAVEPVSISRANSRRERVSQRQRPGGDFRATAAYSGRQRLGSVATRPPKPRKVKDYSAGARNPELRRNAWWARQDSNLQPSGYERVGFTGKPAKNRHFRSRLTASVLVWLRRSIGYLLVALSAWLGIFPLRVAMLGPKRPHQRLAPR